MKTNPAIEYHNQVKRLVDSVYYNDSRNPSEIRELLNLAYRYPHLEIKRLSLSHWLKKYEGYVRTTKKEEAWARVYDLIGEIGIALVSLSRATIDRGGTATQ